MKSRNRFPSVIGAIVLSSTCTFACARDPCQSLICMIGKVEGAVSGNGSSDDGCSQGISDFESIMQIRHGHIDMSATPILRRNYLDGCAGSAVNAAAINAIISQFGNATL